MKYFFIVLFSLFIFKASAFTVRGHVLLNEKWENKVYLSEIDNIRNFFMESTQTIISESTIDSVGYFEFEIPNSSAENKFYRIHFVQKGQTSNDLIIGGKDENFITLILNKNSSVYINGDADNFIETYDVQGSKESSEIRKIQTLRKPFYDAINILDTKMEKAKQSELFSVDSLGKIKKSLYSKICVPALTINKRSLKKFIRNNQNELLNIYAAIYMGFPENFKEEQEFYKELDARLKNNSSYTKQFHQAIEDTDPSFVNSKFLNYLALILVVLFALIFFKIFYERKLLTKRLSSIRVAPIQINNLNIEKLNALELEIYMLVYLNKSAKEITESLSLKLNALKQNVNGIYTKLQIKMLTEN